MRASGIFLSGKAFSVRNIAKAARVWYNRNMRKTSVKGAAALLLALVMTLAAFGCGDGVTGRTYNITGYFGTTVTFAVYRAADAESDALAVRDEIESMLAEVSAAADAQTEGSDVARFNAAGAGERVELSVTGYALFSLAMEMYEQTGGLYDPSVGLSVDLWGFTPRFTLPDYAPERAYDRESANVPPADEYVEAFRGLIGFGDVILYEENGKCYAVKPDRTATVAGDDTVYTMNVDLGGIAKGYVADRAAEIAESHGLTESYVSVGRSSLALGDNRESAEGAPREHMWAVSVAHPRTDGATWLRVYAARECVSTSGDYERAYVYDGKRYCHVIDPRTGSPVDSGVASVTLLGRTAAEADALTTALVVMGREAATEYVNARLTDARVAICEDADGLTMYTNMPETDYDLVASDVALGSRAEDGKIIVL